MLLPLAPVAQAAIPWPQSRVERAFSEAGDGERPLAVFLSALKHGDALPPERLPALLAERAAQGGKAGGFAARLRADLLAAPLPPESLVGGQVAWESVKANPEELTETGEAGAKLEAFLRRHRALQAWGGQGEAGAAWRWQEPVRGPLGVMALPPYVADEGQAVAHVLIPIVARQSGRARLALGGSGALAVSVAHPQGVRALGAIDDLSQAVAGQVTVSVPLEAGENAILISLMPQEPGRAQLSVQWDGGGWGRLGGQPTWPEKAATGALARLKWSPPASERAGVYPTLLRRVLGLPDLGRLKPLEDLDLQPLVRQDDLWPALDALSRSEARADAIVAALMGVCRTPAQCAPHANLRLALAYHRASRGQVVAAQVEVDAQGGLAAEEYQLYIQARLYRMEGRPEEVPQLLDLGQAELSTVLQALEGRPARLWEEFAQAYQALGRASWALEIYTQLLSHQPGRSDWRAAAIHAAEASGALGQAVGWLEAEVKRRPDRPRLALSLAEILLDRGQKGDLAEARALVEATAAWSWHSADLMVERGLLYERLGETEAALAAWREALALDPADAVARRHAERLGGESPSPIRLDLDALVERPPLDPDADVEILGEAQVVQIGDDGSQRRFARRLIRVQHPLTAKGSKAFELEFDPERYELEVQQAQIYRAEAGMVGSFSARESIPERHFERISEAWYGLYYDLVRLSIPIHRARVGDIVELSWSITPRQQPFRGQTDLLQPVAGAWPIHQFSMEVHAPPHLALQTRLNVPPFWDSERLRVHTLEAEGGGRIYRLQGHNLPALPRSPRAPGLAELSPVWQLSSFQDWDDLSRFYRQLIVGQQVLTPEMREFVAEAKRESKDREALLHRLSHAVAHDFRYVGLEFGVHGIKPYRTDQVWNRRFGDCKDKANLLVLLLETAGIRAEFVLVRTRPRGRLSDALPSMALFDHAMVFIPEWQLFFDPTAPSYSLGKLPSSDEGAQVLRIVPEDDTAALELSPVLRPAANGISGDYAVTFNERGEAGFQAVVEFLGHQAAYYRAYLSDEEIRNEWLRQTMAHRYPGFRLLSYGLDQLEESLRPLVLTFHGEVSQFNQLRGEARRQLSLTQPTGMTGHLSRFAEAESRSVPLVLGPPMRWHLVYRYVIPDGYVIEQLPESGSASEDFGAYEIQFSQEGQVLTVRSELYYAVDQISVALYPAFRRFLQGLERLVEQEVFLSYRPEPAPAGEAPHQENETPTGEIQQSGGVR